MSRHSPSGFGLGILVEIAAVIAIVSFLPRIDLRPAAALPVDSAGVPPSAPAAYAGESAVSPVSWTPVDIKNGEVTRATSYYERAEPAPPLETKTAGSFATQSQGSPQITIPQSVDRATDAKYVEDRLDRASQKLVNSVGSAVTSAANSILPPAGSKQSFRTMPARPEGGPATVQHRPWLRY